MWTTVPKEHAPTPPSNSSNNNNNNKSKSNFKSSNQSFNKKKSLKASTSNKQGSSSRRQYYHNKGKSSSSRSSQSYTSHNSGSSSGGDVDGVGVMEHLGSSSAGRVANGSSSSSVTVNGHHYPAQSGQQHQHLYQQAPQPGAAVAVAVAAQSSPRSPQKRTRPRGGPGAVMQPHHGHPHHGHHHGPPVPQPQHPLAAINGGYLPADPSEDHIMAVTSPGGSSASGSARRAAQHNQLSPPHQQQPPFANNSWPSSNAYRTAQPPPRAIQLHGYPNHAPTAMQLDNSPRPPPQQQPPPPQPYHVGNPFAAAAPEADMLASPNSNSSNAPPGVYPPAAAHAYAVAIQHQQHSRQPPQQPNFYAVDHHASASMHPREPGPYPGPAGPPGSAPGPPPGGPMYAVHDAAAGLPLSPRQPSSAHKQHAHPQHPQALFMQQQQQQQQQAMILQQQQQMQQRRHAYEMAQRGAAGNTTASQIQAQMMAGTTSTTAAAAAAAAAAPSAAAQGGGGLLPPNPAAQPPPPRGLFSSSSNSITPDPSAATAAAMASNNSTSSKEASSRSAPSQSQPQSSSSSSSLRGTSRRLPSERPVVRLSAKLIDTYRNINRVYYEERAKRRAARAAEHPHPPPNQHPHPQQQQQQQQQHVGARRGGQEAAHHPQQQPPHPRAHPQHQEEEEGSESGTTTTTTTQQAQAQSTERRQSQSQSSSSQQQQQQQQQQQRPEWDDENYDYRVTRDELFYNRYVIRERIGQGSFGQVVRARDNATDRDVAIKIIKSRRPFHIQAQTEIELLVTLRAMDPHDEHNIVRLETHFIYRNHQCLVFEMLSLNLYELLRNTQFGGVSLNLIRKFARQILKALMFLGRPDVNIIHCDLKPENILLRHPKRSSIKVVDFGSSCRSNRQTYSYIQSRFYRSPEVMLGLPYSVAIDMWSLGCILVEMHTGEPLFSGSDQFDQMQKIVEVLGMVPSRLIDRSSGRHRDNFFERRPDGGGGSTPGRRNSVDGNSTSSSSSWVLRQNPNTSSSSSSNSNHTAIVPSRDPLGSLSRKVRAETNRRRQYEESPRRYDLFEDLILRMLSFDPQERIRPIDALRHPFITEGEVSSGSHQHHQGEVKRGSDS